MFCVLQQREKTHLGRDAAVQAETKEPDQSLVSHQATRLEFIIHNIYFSFYLWRDMIPREEDKNTFKHENKWNISSIDLVEGLKGYSEVVFLKFNLSSYN